MTKRIPSAQLNWLTDLPIAHRGLHNAENGIVENTLSAVLAAAEDGYAIEIDVQLSADGKAMVFHDKDLKRLCGRDELLAELSCEELGQIAHIQSTDTILPLEVILEQVAGRVPIIIELKKNPPHDEALVAGVLAALEGYEGHAAVMSFGHEIVSMLSDANHNWPVGLVAEGNSGTANTHQKGMTKAVSFVSYCVDDLPNDFCDYVRLELDLKLITWTVRTPEQVERTFAFADQMTFEGFGPHLA